MRRTRTEQLRIEADAKLSEFHEYLNSQNCDADLVDFMTSLGALITTTCQVLLFDSSDATIPHAVEFLKELQFTTVHSIDGNLHSIKEPILDVMRTSRHDKTIIKAVVMTFLINRYPDAQPESHAFVNEGWQMDYMLHELMGIA